MARLWIRAVFFLGGIVFLSRNAGEMTNQLERTFGFLFFAIFCLSHIERRIYKRRPASVVAGILLFVASRWLLRSEPVSDVCAIALMTLGLWFIVSGMGLPANDLVPYAFTALAFALVLLLGKTSAYAWYVGRWFSDFACALGNLLCGSDIHFRPNYAGLPITALLLLFWSIRWIYAEKQRWQDIVWLVALTLAAQITYLLVAAGLLRVGLPIVESVAGRSSEQLNWYQALLVRSMPWNLPFLFFLINVPIILWGATRLARAAEASSMPRSTRRALRYVQLVLVVLVLVIIRPSGVYPNLQPGSKTVVFYEKGFLNWSKPEFGRYGPLSIGMFGNLPQFVETLGLNSRMAPEITTDTLRGASVLVIINPTDPWSEGTTATIWRFVKQGGSLLLLGDHTAYDGETGRVYVNDLLQPAAIRFNFDSADCPVGGWLHCYDFQWHPLTRGLRDERNEAGIVVGASLAIRRPAYPIILGRDGYEDRGNKYAPDHAYLGNMKFDADEPLGGPVLVAAQRYGKGKVLVFGDTSSYVNGILVSTYNFLGRVFKWLATPAGRSRLLLPALFAFLMLIMLILLLQWGSLPNQDLLLFWTALVALVVLAATPAREPRHEIAEKESPVRIAYVDQAHLPMASQEGWRDDGLMGLEVNLMRNGLLTFNLYERTLPEDASLYVIVAPARRFSRREIRRVREYLEQGGNVIVAVGSEESSGSQKLLAEFGLRVEALPLGYFRTTSPVIGAEAMFWEAWQVTDYDKKAQVVAGYGERPVIVIKQVGTARRAGNLVLIGDSNFLLNKNIETEKSHNESNVAFLGALLKHLGISSASEAGR